MTTKPKIKATRAKAWHPSKLNKHWVYTLSYCSKYCLEIKNWVMKNCFLLKSELRSCEVNAPKLSSRGWFKCWNLRVRKLWDLVKEFILIREIECWILKLDHSRWGPRPNWGTISLEYPCALSLFNFCMFFWIWS